MCSLGTCDDCLRNVTILAGGDGTDGTNGNVIRIGTGAPDPALYNDNDFYIDQNSPLNFYHKVAGAWVYIARLQGVDGNGFLVSESRLITAAELLNSLSAPVVVTGMPPAGYSIVPVSITGSLHYNSIPYNAPFGLSVVFNDTSSSFVGSWTTSFIQSAQSIMATMQVNPQATLIPQTPLAVKPNYPGTITTGNSSLLVRSVYYITPA